MLKWMDKIFLNISIKPIEKFTFMYSNRLLPPKMVDSSQRIANNLNKELIIFDEKCSIKDLKPAKGG